MTTEPQVLSARIRWRDRGIATVVLVAVWMLLWGVFSWANLVSGLVVAAVILAVFPLPPVTFQGRPHPFGMVRFAARFVLDLFIASVQLAWTAFRFGHQPRSAVIAVPLRVRSDLNLTLTAISISLVPGSLIVDTDQESSTLYIHVLGVSNPAEVERFRRGVYAVEARIVRAIGSSAEIDQVALPAFEEKGPLP